MKKRRPLFKPRKKKPLTWEELMEKEKSEEEKTLVYSTILLAQIMESELEKTFKYLTDSRLAVEKSLDIFQIIADDLIPDNERTKPECHS